MLFILTAAIQSGKTRWLEEMVAKLQGRGVEVSGVLTPGVWKEQPEHPAINHVGKGKALSRFIKCGIDALLLPEGERIFFAKPLDCAPCSQKGRSVSQSARAGLGWDISDKALERINKHFHELVQGDRSTKGGLLVVDELGRLELECSGGLIEALHVIERGPTHTFPHVVVVVRLGLCAQARHRLALLWDHVITITPGRQAEDMLIAAFDRQDCAL